MFEIYGNAMMAAVYVLEGIFLNYLSVNFSEADLNKDGKFRYLPGIVWAAAEEIIFFGFTFSFDGYLLINQASGILVLFLFFLIFNSGSLIQRLFPAIMFISVRELSAEVSACLTGLGNIVTKPVYDLCINGAISPESYPMINGMVYSAFFTCIGAVRLALIYFTVRRLVRYYRYRQNLKANMTVYIIPALAGIIAAALIKVIIVTFEDGYTVIIYSRFPVLYLIIPVLSLTLLASVVITFKQCQDMTGLQLENAEKIVLENQIMHMQNTLLESEQLYENIRSVRHDMKNNMAVMQSLLEKKCPDDEEITQYFNEMLSAAEQPYGKANTGNAVCDSIIGGKFRYAEKMIPDIRLNSDDFVFKSGGIKAYDIGIILNNGLDNAVEACMNLKNKYPESEAFINVRSFRKRGMFFIEIENSFDGILKKDNISGLLLSLKADPELHGIGMRNIKKCAERYSGGIDFIAENNKFTLAVMMKEEKICQ